MCMRVRLLATLGFLLLVTPGCAYYGWSYCKSLDYPGWLSCIKPPPADSTTLLRFGEVPYPNGNPYSEDKKELGKKLFFEKRLSKDKTVSCASCHDPDKGFADSKQFPTGVDGAVGGIHTPTVLNTAYNRHLFWNGRVGSLEEQALKPIENDKEMGPEGNLNLVVAELNNDSDYTARFHKVFGTGVTPKGIAMAIATYERTLISRDTPFERWVREEEPISKAAQRGWKVFVGKGRCANCHVPPAYTDDNYHNIGVRPVSGQAMDKDLNGFLSRHPDYDRSYETFRVDKCAFKTPTLLNIEQTAPYMHNGSFQELKDVVSFYVRGGDPVDPAVCGQKDWRIVQLDLSLEEQNDLIEFLKSLTGKVPLDSLPKQAP